MITRNPLNRSRVIRVDIHDRNDVIVENSLSQTKQFQDMEKVNQLTQNSWNFSPYTREDVYRDVTIENPKPMGRIERYKNKVRPGKYHSHVERLL